MALVIREQDRNGDPAGDNLLPEGTVIKLPESRLTYVIGSVRGYAAYGATVYSVDFRVDHGTGPSDVRKQMVKAVPTNEVENYTRLLGEIQRNTNTGVHPNIVGAQKSFVRGGVLCVTMNSPHELGSLRSFLERLPGGILPQDCISVVLNEAVTGLARVHKRRMVHGDVNAGHIYYFGDSSIKLGFAGTVWESNPGDNLHRFASFSREFSAPEVSGEPATKHTAKSDVWLIGIAALELAYGTSAILNLTREGLMHLIKHISANNRMPKVQEMRARNWNDWSDGKMKKVQRFFSKCLTRMPLPVVVTPEEGGFEAKFVWMVRCCLQESPFWRPTAKQLLRCDALRSNLGVSHFEKIVTSRLHTRE